ncbi:MAG: Dihydrolipoyllysine-residue acetyltransferase [Myxococcales bacterium]|nr:Dihydrolipoyllysine-residue acetyltransferase [Myxococcales bacterium]
MASIITMPKLSPTMEEGVLAKWTKKEGDKIQPGDVIAEVETDKANMEFPLEDEGVLLKLLVKEGDTVKLGDPVAVLGEAGEDLADVMKEVGQKGAQPQKKTDEPAAPPVAATVRAETGDREQGDTKAPDPTRAAAKSVPVAKPAPASKQAAARPALSVVQAEPANGNGHGRVLASPFARKLALEKGVDLKRLSGSGPHGRIIKRDIDEAAAHGEAAPSSLAYVPSREDQLVPASQMRKTIARRLIEAKREIPHIYLTADATVDRLVEMREQLNDSGTGTEGAVKVSINDLVIKALAMALARMPDANVSWTAEGILRHGGVHIGMAVSLPDNGLITPVVRDADVKSIGALARETRSLAERARAKKLKPEEYSGGSATVSNLGMFGVREFVAIINPPESVILAVGTTEKRPIVVTRDGHDVLEVARRMTLTLSCDHRVVDGVLGAKLLGEVVKLLEKPMGMLL